LVIAFARWQDGAIGTVTDSGDDGWIEVHWDDGQISELSQGSGVNTSKNLREKSGIAFAGFSSPVTPHCSSRYNAMSGNYCSCG
jgi:hypothetical protein